MSAPVGPPPMPPPPNHPYSLPRSSSAPGDAALHHSASMSLPHGHSMHTSPPRSAGTDDMAATQELIDDSIYKVTEHKQEVRLGLRHRNSFSVHKSHMKGEGGGGTGGGGTMAAILAAFSDSAASSGGAAAQPSAGASPPAKKKNPLKSMVKGVGSFLGVRKSKKKRQAEEAAKAAAAAATAASRVVGAPGTGAPQYAMSTNPLVAVGEGAEQPSLQRSDSAGSVDAESVEEFDDGGSDDDDTEEAGVHAIDVNGDMTGLASARGNGGVVSSATDPTSPATSPVAAGGVSSSSFTMRSLPPVPALAAGGGPPPPPPPPPISTPTSGGARAPPPPPPPPPAYGSPAGRSPGYGADEGGPDAPLSQEGGDGYLLSTTHHDDTPVRSILKTSPTKTARGEGTPAGGGGRRRISFADQHGQMLENIKWCEDLHYSVNSDHSESETWEEGADKSNCVLM